MNKPILFFATFFIVCVSYAQIVENFEEETIGNTPDLFSPVWVGDTQLFTLVSDGGSKQLRTNTGTLSSSTTYQISTPFTDIDNSSWEFYVNLKLATSGANFVEVHLVSDNSNLQNSQNGYFVRIGESADRIALYPKVAGAVGTALLASPNGITENKAFKIRVTRDAIGNWTMEYDQNSSGSYVSTGTALHSTATTNSHFGILIVQSTAAGAVNNHFFDDIIIGADHLAPEINSISIIAQNKIDVTFNEPVDESSAELMSNYTITNGVTVMTAELDDANSSLVHLTSSSMVNGNTYTLSVANVEDQKGNAIETSIQKDFTYLVFSVAGFRDVQINEFMSDPSPSLGLPEVDFVELYNPTANSYNLSGWRIADGAGQSGPMEAYTLSPGAYLIVCASADKAAFATYGSTIGVSSFPNFNSSSADKVVVLNANGLEIDKVAYSSGLAIDGVTNEQVNPQLVCSGTFNFKPSQHGIGGTPGTQNSVFMVVADNFAPKLLNGRAITADSLRLDFDKVLNPNSVQLTDFSTQPVIGLKQVYVLESYPSTVFIKLSANIPANTSYTVGVSGISDCAGNFLTPTSTHVLLGLLPENEDILLSEILFNPRSGSVDFVEIFNPSETKNFELRNWKLARLVDGLVDTPVDLASTGLILEPKQFLVFSTNSSNISLQYPLGNPTRYVQLSRLPSYNDDLGIVLLLNEANEIVQRFDYDEEFHYALLDNNEGVSLERLSYTSSENNPNNWRSAASTVGFATPGRPNSQGIEEQLSNATVTIDPKVFLPGNSGSGRDFTMINYRMEQAGKFANVIVYDQQGRPIMELANGASLATTGFFRWDGTTSQGGLARMGYYLVVFDIYDGQGNRQVLKETVVVGRDF